MKPIDKICEALECGQPADAYFDDFGDVCIWHLIQLEHPMTIKAKVKRNYTDLLSGKLSVTIKNTHSY